MQPEPQHWLGAWFEIAEGTHGPTILRCVVGALEAQGCKTSTSKGTQQRKTTVLPSDRRLDCSNYLGTHQVNACPKLCRTSAKLACMPPFWSPGCRREHDCNPQAIRCPWLGKVRMQASCQLLAVPPLSEWVFGKVLMKRRVR